MLPSKSSFSRASSEGSHKMNPSASLKTKTQSITRHSPTSSSTCSWASSQTWTTWQGTPPAGGRYSKHLNLTLNSRHRNYQNFAISTRVKLTSILIRMTAHNTTEIRREWWQTSFSIRQGIPKVLCKGSKTKEEQAAKEIKHQYGQVSRSFKWRNWQNWSSTMKGRAGLASSYSKSLQISSSRGIAPRNTSRSFKIQKSKIKWTWR